MNARPTLDALQALRGAAALLVVWDHAWLNIAPAPPSAPYVLGALGVSVFFVISGFIMVYIHGEEFGLSGAAPRFFGRRLVRIAPFYALVTLVFAARLYAGGRGPAPLDLLRSLLFIPYANPLATYGQPVLGQGWTLNYEAFFYLLFGLALLWRHGLALVAAGLAGLCALGQLGLFPPKSWFGFWSQPDILFFLAGMGAAVLRRRLPRGPGFALALGLAAVPLALAAVTALLAPAHAPATMRVAAVAAACACAWARESPGRGPLRRMLVRLGDATFAIYLTHTLLIGPATKATLAHAPSMPAWAFIAAMLPLATAAGLLVHRWIEAPLIGACRRLPRLRTATPQVTHG